MRLKYVSVIETGTTPPTVNNDYYDNGNTLWVKPDDLNNFIPIETTSRMLTPQGVAVSRQLEANSVLVCGIGSIGKFGYANEAVCTNQQLNGITFCTKLMNNKFGLFLISAMKDELQRNSEKVVVSILTKSRQSCISIAVPPIYEQQTIFQNLDQKTSQIDSLIKKLERKIELLKEYRTSLISRCVTKGLDSDVEMKDSGIEWIGEIPIHWIVNRISRATYVKGRIGWKGLKSDEFIDEGPYLITGTDFKNGRIDWSETYHVQQQRYAEDPFIIVQNDDVLITKDGTIGKIAHVVDLPGPATLNSGIFVTRPLSNSYLQRYFYWILNSKIFTTFIDYSSSGTTIRHLYQNVFENFYLPLPSLNEQRDVANFLDQKTSHIDSLTAKLKRKIELLQEYRQSLISNVVTGKTRVSENE